MHNLYHFNSLWADQKKVAHVRRKVRWLMLPLIMLTFGLVVSSSVYAWDSHFLLTYAALKDSPEVGQLPHIPAETLASFLQKEKTGLVKLLDDNEKWSRAHLPVYPPLPQDLAFKESNKTKPLQSQFVEAIRINPTMTFPLFVQYPPNTPDRIHKRPLARLDVMLPELANSDWISIPNPPLEKISQGERVSPLDVIISAVDEPDYGMDIHLWEDSPSWFGKIYQWGEQPFGNKTLSFGSQAPFHMGFYYESSILYMAGPFLKHSYLEYRVHLYLTLSRYAFKTGHSYWGYRFLGWALHYIQDLTQPYHSTVAPNVSIIKLISDNTLDLIGIHRFKQNTLQLVSNRHLSLENYEYFMLEHILEQHDINNRFIKALTDQHHDSTYPAYSDFYSRDVVAKESNAKANQVDSSIRTMFPKKYVMDPEYIFYTTEPDVDLYKVIEQHPNNNSEQFDLQLSGLLRAFGSHTRNVIKSTIENDSSH